MKLMNRVEGKLKMDVASEGNYIPAGTLVVVDSICDNFNNLSVEVSSVKTTVRLSYYDTFVSWLV